MMRFPNKSAERCRLALGAGWLLMPRGLGCESRKALTWFELLKEDTEVV